MWALILHGIALIEKEFVFLLTSGQSFCYFFYQEPVLS